MSKDNLYDGEDEVKSSVKPVTGLQTFVNENLQNKLPLNWHHRLYYDILENKLVQKADGKLYLNSYEHEGKLILPDDSKWEAPKLNKNILMMSPRFHSKSQCFTINYPIYRIYKNHDIRILIVSANDDIAQSFNRAIINNLENNQKLIENHGYLVPEYPKKWGEKALLVKRDSMEKDPTVAAIGVGGKLISRRADIIIIDDPIDMETARTKTARNKTREWFENVLLPILEDDGQLIIAGTAWYRGDIYDTLWQESNFDIKLKLKALIYHAGYVRDSKSDIRFIPWKLTDFPMALKIQDVLSDEVIHRYALWERLQSGVLWEAKWSFPKLISKKESQNMSNGSFLRQYLNEPTSEEEKVFKEGDLKRLVERGYGKELVNTWDNSNPKKEYGYGHLIIGVGVDLAISKAKTSDNSAIAVWGLTDDRRRVCLYLDYGKWSPDEVKQRVLEVYYNFRPVKVRVENIAFQDMLRQELAQDIEVEGFHTTSSKKFNPETGLAHLAMLTEQDKMLIPMGKQNKTYHERVLQLLYEMQVYAYDQHAGDVLMASWFAMDILKDFDKKLRDNRGFFNTESLVEQMKNIRAAHKLLILSPTFYKRVAQSFFHVFRPVPDDGSPFIEPDEPFFIFATREERSVAYIFHKVTNEFVARLEGDMTAILFVNLLETAGKFFNNCQIIVDRNNEGEAVYLELEKRTYPSLLCFQPDEHGLPIYKEGFKSSAATLPIAIDTFQMNVDQLKYQIPDESLVKEMGDTIGVEQDKMVMSFGTGQRIRTAAIGLWLLENYENMEKQGPKKVKIKKKVLRVPYRIFREH